MVLDDRNRIFGGRSVRPVAGWGGTDLLRQNFDIRDLDVDRLVWQVFEVQAVPGKTNGH